jgi:purine-binding chemotaxis protein CheW
MNESGSAENSQYLSFMLDLETYAMDIMQVREVLDYTRITRVPRMPDFMRGVINLRGGVVPVVDLRLKFGMGETPKTDESCIIIIEAEFAGEGTQLGIMVDSVQEVLSLSADQIQPPPRIGTRLKTEFIRGMGRKDDAFIIILETERVFSTEELTVMQAAPDPEVGRGEGGDAG